MKEQDLGNGITIIGFDSPEEMQAYMEARSKQLAEDMLHLTEPQRGIVWGSYVIRLLPIELTREQQNENIHAVLFEGQDQGPHQKETLAIFGYLYTREEYRESELEAGSDEEELEYTMSRLEAAYEQGFRAGRWHSVVTPDGEFGDAHITTLWPITEADYQHALNNGWELPLYLQTRIIDEMAAIEGEEE